MIQLRKDEPVITLSWEHDQYEWLTQSELMDKDVPRDADDYFLTVLDYLITS
jgi:hypothetical protein